MGTEVLPPQDWLIERLRVGPADFVRRKSYAGGNSKPGRKSASKSEPRKRYPSSQAEPSVSRKWTGNSFDDSSKSSKNPFTGPVTILKRGESLDSRRSRTKNNHHHHHHNYSASSSSSSSSSCSSPSSSASVDLIVSGTERLGPDPEMVPKQFRIADLKMIMSPVGVRSDMYAGAGFCLSPSPSSLPLPSFSKKKDELAIVDDSATKDLRRLLRLD